MSRIAVRNNESIERALRRFKKACKRDGLFMEVKRRRCYIKPSEKRRNQRNKARK